ncbi:glycosyltransferase [Pedobacter frigidisoli]|uniref:Glycosyltransferase n=1 Tax=Pedobacter frigidisoli TaxID=2530455 RepID=A0A4R0NMD1_9SPHI|nr:glycosyltransferase [Pedobacter frigidisoli]TCD01981.1 glycosyltransferase [Pedobacter frigidisoli]
MTIYFLSTTFFSDVDINLLKHLAKEHKIIYGVIFSKLDSNYTIEELEDLCGRYNIEFVPINLKYRHRNPRNLITFYKVLRSIKKSKADLLYTLDFNELYLNTMMFFLRSAKSTIVGFHDVENHSGTKNAFFANFAKHLLFKKFRFLQTFSNVQNNLLRDMYPKKNIFSIPMTLKDFGEKPLIEPTKQVCFLFFGNILPYKGLDNLMKCVNRLAEKRSNFKLIIAGRSNDWNEVYEPLIEHPEVLETHIGFIENKEIPEYFTRANYLVLPYRDVTQSGPMSIAYHYNVPIIATDLEGFREFIAEDVSGYLFDGSDVNGLYAVLENAIMRSDEEYSALKDRLASFVATEFSSESVVEKYNRMFDFVKEHA